MLKMVGIFVESVIILTAFSNAAAEYILAYVEIYKAPQKALNLFWKIAVDTTLGDWKVIFKYPNCGGGHCKIENAEIICKDCGYREPFCEDFKKVIDG